MTSKRDKSPNWRRRLRKKRSCARQLVRELTKRTLTFSDRVSEEDWAQLVFCFEVTTRGRELRRDGMQEANRDRIRLGGRHGKDQIDNVPRTERSSKGKGLAPTRRKSRRRETRRKETKSKRRCSSSRTTFSPYLQLQLHLRPRSSSWRRRRPSRR